MKHIVLFDGDCSFCNVNVDFLIRHDKKDIFRFYSLDSAFGIYILAKYQVDSKNLNSIVSIKNDKARLKSSAVFAIVWDLGGIFLILFVFYILPFKDYFYDLIAKNRHKIFKSKCKNKFS